MAKTTKGSGGNKVEAMPSTPRQPGGSAGVSEEDFRQLALGFSGVAESAHQGHPDFRLQGKIFASLGYPAGGFGMVKLTPEQQQVRLAEAPEAFAPCAGVWGVRGATSVRLAAVSLAGLESALREALGNLKVKSAKQKSTGAGMSARSGFDRPGGATRNVGTGREMKAKG